MLKKLTHKLKKKRKKEIKYVWRHPLILFFLLKRHLSQRCCLLFLLCFSILILIFSQRNRNKTRNGSRLGENKEIKIFFFLSNSETFFFISYYFKIGFNVFTICSLTWDILVLKKKLIIIIILSQVLNTFSATSHVLMVAFINNFQ
jgi:hypothetical protein